MNAGNTTHKSFWLMLIFSSVLYGIMAAAQKYGQSQFYHPFEHFLVFLYCVTSYCCLRYFLSRCGDALRVQDYIKVSVQGGLLTSIITTLIWLGIRAIVAVLLGINQGLPSISAILMNVMFVLCTIYLVVAGAYLSYHYLRHANAAVVQKTLAERATADAQAKLLMQQFTPHFLFNNLNVLSALIATEPEHASDFVVKLARLYRFQIQHKGKGTVTLQEELLFIDDYMALMNVRFGDVYHLRKANKLKTFLERRVLPGALQLLIENAIKHNVASTKSPLTIGLEIGEDSLTVHHRRSQRKQGLPSTGTGLNNLRERYFAYSSVGIAIEQSEQHFSVTIPLLDA